MLVKFVYVAVTLAVPAPAVAPSYDKVAITESPGTMVIGPFVVFGKSEQGASSLLQENARFIRPVCPPVFLILNG
jgi:hypothetical protein